MSQVPNWGVSFPLEMPQHWLHLKLVGAGTLCPECISRVACLHMAAIQVGSCSVAHVYKTVSMACGPLCAQTHCVGTHCVRVQTFAHG